MFRGVASRIKQINFGVEACRSLVALIGASGVGNPMRPYAVAL